MEGFELVSVCTNYSIPQLETYNLIWSIMGLLMAVVTAAILVLLLLRKAFHSLLQRMFLWLTFFTLLSLTNNFSNIQLHFESAHAAGCKYTGFIDVCVFITCLLLSTGIGLYLLFMVYFHIQGKPMPKVNKCKTVAIEVVFLVIVVALPPLVLYNDLENFGVSGPICWVNIYEKDDSCTLINISLQHSILILYTTVMAINFILFLLLKLISCLIARQYRQVRSHHILMAKRAALLVFFLAAYFVINTGSLWVHHLTSESHIIIPSPILVILNVIVPASPILIPLGFIYYLKSTKRVKTQKTAFNSCLCCCCCRRKHVTELTKPVSVNTGTPVINGSCYQDMPSQTMSREVQYTGGFTDIPSTFVTSHSQWGYGAITKTTDTE